MATEAAHDRHEKKGFAVFESGSGGSGPKKQTHTKNDPKRVVKAKSHKEETTNAESQ
jgi:hypothetical protein